MKSKITRQSTREATKILPFPNAIPPIKSPSRLCWNCQTDKTPMWRRIQGVYVCNACGLYHKHHGYHRSTKNEPPIAKTQTIESPLLDSPPLSPPLYINQQIPNQQETIDYDTPTLYTISFYASDALLLDDLSFNHDPSNLFFY